MSKKRVFPNLPTSKADNSDSEMTARCRTGCKTPQVLKLVEKDPGKGNQVIMAGKSRIPEQLRGREPLSRIMKRDLGADLGEQFADSQDTIVVNITELAIEYEAPAVLDRFNACSCDKCVEVFSRKISESVPARFARVNKFTHRTPTRELRERVEPMRRVVLSAMIRELIGNKKRCFHD